MILLHDHFCHLYRPALPSVNGVEMSPRQLFEYSNNNGFSTETVRLCDESVDGNDFNTAPDTSEETSRVVGFEEVLYHGMLTPQWHRERRQLGVNMIRTLNALQPFLGDACPTASTGVTPSNELNLECTDPMLRVQFSFVSLFFGQISTVCCCQNVFVFCLSSKYS